MCAITMMFIVSDWFS